MPALKPEKQVSPIFGFMIAFVLIFSIVRLLTDHAAALEAKNLELKELLGSELRARQRCEAKHENLQL